MRGDILLCVRTIRGWEGDATQRTGRIETDADNAGDHTALCKLAYS
jgi:hypothetical protein